MVELTSLPLVRRRSEDQALASLNMGDHLKEEVEDLVPNLSKLLSEFARVGGVRMRLLSLVPVAGAS